MIQKLIKMWTHMMIQGGPFAICPTNNG